MPFLFTVTGMVPGWILPSLFMCSVRRIILIQVPNTGSIGPSVLCLSDSQTIMTQKNVVSNIHIIYFFVDIRCEVIL